MSRTITALFDSRSDAEAAKNRLHMANIDANHVHVHDQSSPGFRSEGAYSDHQDRGMWDSIKNALLPDEDRHAYEEGVRRGGALLTADVEEDQIDDAVRVLEDSNSIDVDDRSQQWRSQGWDYGTGSGADTATGSGLGTARRVGSEPGLGLASGGAFGAATGRDTSGREAFRGRDRDTASASGNTVEEEALPVVEESLQVGKREVDRGGVRVRSYVTETPVHEQLRLRNERVDVERRAVDQPLSATDGDPFRERTVEMTARGEEAMVEKKARVVEEVVVRKTADEEVRDIDDTVRRTDVEVDNDVSRNRTAGTDDRGILGGGTKRSDY
ncbi:YsnF/AvaK domain-containing protein [Sphingomonas aerophila]|uniref:Uncharacterized protein (TIGR02271 family) n=1 Tax=Sphingomonas aerophila TaxID=1344948 RepID=A0A7W9ETW4_9SPHN|nr:YsnF/AvaK domain-containing protein [Sphingomonas aerophila]MBB5714591.1 uncharacterized protein (TIGR02271 family) [Sphingomonas aerophila]